MVEKELIIDNMVGLKALTLYIKNQNLEVGTVTVRHMIFSELLVQVRSGCGLTDARLIWKFCFRNTGESKVEYKSPLGFDRDKWGIPCIHVTEGLANEVYQRCKTMAVSERNIIDACADLIACGRAFQELTIDATKTMKNVFIPYADDMSRVHLMSRDMLKSDYDIKCDWEWLEAEDNERIELTRRRENKAAVLKARGFDSAMEKDIVLDNVLYKLDMRNSRTTRNPKGQEIRIVSDYGQHLRRMMLLKGVDFAQQMMEIRQDFSIDSFEDIWSRSQHYTVRACMEIGEFFLLAYRTISSYKKQRMSEARKLYPERSIDLDEANKEIRRATTLAYKYLGNQIRCEFKKYGIEGETAIRLLMCSTAKIGINSYAHQILSEEFFRYVIHLYDNDPDSCTWTEDKLVKNNFEDGTWVNFEDGIAEESFRVRDENGNKQTKTGYAFARVPLQGRFLIKKKQREDGSQYWVATKPLVDIIEAPEIEENTVCFVTKAGGGNDWYTAYNHMAVQAALQDSRDDIMLVPYSEHDGSVHDAIVCEHKKIVGHFMSSFLSDEQKKSNEKIKNSRTILGMYQNMCGKLAHIVSARQINDDGTDIGTISFVVLSNVERENTPRNLIDATVEERDNAYQGIDMDFDIFDLSDESKPTCTSPFSHALEEVIAKDRATNNEESTEDPIDDIFGNMVEVAPIERKTTWEDLAECAFD